MSPAGRVLESLFSLDFTVRGGQIVRYRLMEDKPRRRGSLAS